MNNVFERQALSAFVNIDQKSLGKETHDDYKFSYISLSDVSVGQINKKLETHEFSSAPSRARRVLQSGDILLATVRPNLQGFAQVTDEFSSCIASTGFAVLNPKENVSGEFIYQYLYSYQITKQIESLVVGSNYPAINSSDVAGLHIYAPPLQEQRKIAKILSTWDKAICTTERLIDNSKQKKKALMQQLLTGKKRLLDDSGKPFEGEWGEVLVGKVAELTAGGTPSTKKGEYWGGDIPWMNSGEINLKQVFSVEGRITELGLQNSSTKQIPENSVLIALAGQGKTRGTVAINRIELCTNQSIAAIMPKRTQLYPEFLYFNLDNRYQELRSMSTGDGGRGGLNLSILKAIRLQLPTISEQKKIASVLTNADKEIEVLQQQLSDLKQEKKALMQQLLTGKRRVTVDDEVVA